MGVALLLSSLQFRPLATCPTGACKVLRCRAACRHDCTSVISLQGVPWWSLRPGTAEDFAAHLNFRCSVLVHYLALHLLSHDSDDGGDGSDLQQPRPHVQHIRAPSGYCCFICRVPWRRTGIDLWRPPQPELGGCSAPELPADITLATFSTKP